MQLVVVLEDNSFRLVLIAIPVREHELGFEVLSCLADRWMHNKFCHDFSIASRGQHPIARQVGARVYYKDCTIRARFARPHNTDTVQVYRLLGPVGDLPGTDDLHGWLVADRGRVPPLVTHERVASHGPYAEGLPGETGAVSSRRAPYAARPRPTTQPRKDDTHGRKKRANGCDDQSGVLTGTPLQNLFPHTPRPCIHAGDSYPRSIVPPSKRCQMPRAGS